MLKKRVLTVSLSLLCCLCLCFSGFGSVNASAATVSPNAETEWFLLPFDNVAFDDTSNDLNGVFSYSSGTYNGNLSASGDWIKFTCSDIGAVMPYLYAEHDYLLYFTFSIECSSVIDVNRLVFRFDQSSTGSSSGNLPITYIRNSYVNETSTTTGICTFNTSSLSGGEPFLSTASGLWVNLYSSYSCLGRISWAFYLLDVTDNTQEQLDSIITAINNQTSSLSGSIGQAADDIQQSIEDQYEMDAAEDFGFSDIQEQYEEKMGVLTFGTETTLQMLDLFSPSNAGEAVIRVPAFSMDIQGTTYQIWDEYVFRFSWIEKWIPFLIKTMRTFNVVMFYLAILHYVNKVYERNFLAK